MVTKVTRRVITRFETVYTTNRSVQMPANRIDVPDPAYVYVPLRGYSASLAVFQNGRCVGWIDTRKLGYENAKAWVAGTGWIDQGLQGFRAQSV
jgi:hypothetical protein